MKVINVSVKYLRPTFQNLKEWLKTPNHLYIGRRNIYIEGAEGSKWANPFSVKKFGRDKCIEMYEEYIRNTPDLWNFLDELKEKILGCWCDPNPCHGHVLMKLLKEKEM